jgi:integrase
MADLAKRPKKKGGMRSPRYIEETQRNFDNHVLPRWGTNNIRDIDRRAVNDLLDGIADEGTNVRGEDGGVRHLEGGGIAANRTRAAVQALFNWAVDRGVIDSNPASRLSDRGEEKGRDRTLDGDEIRAIWPQARALGYPFGPFFMLALATGQRRDEVAKIEWPEIDEAARTWTIPKKKTKGKREHVVPLSQLALDIIAEAKDFSKALAKTRSDTAKTDHLQLPRYVFSTRGNRPISGFSKAKDDLDENIAAALKKAGHKQLERWTIHDMRRSCATSMGDLGISPHVIECVLNHASGFRAGVGGVYNHSLYLPQMREALDKWAKHLSTITKPKSIGTEKRSAA